MRRDYTMNNINNMERPVTSDMDFVNHDRRVDRDALLMAISETEFAALELQLFLNTHPCDIEGIKNYNHLTMEAKKLRDEYEKHFGPLFSYISMSDDNYFTWIDEPWPWDRDFMNTPLNNNMVRR